jgi:Arc/MetJ family transcription regulator
MRTTLDIDDDVLAAAKELSRQQGRTAGQVVSELMRRALSGGVAAPAKASTRGARALGGFRPFASRGSPVTNAKIDALRDTEGT